MKVLVTGVNGQLGFDVIKNLELMGVECKGVDREDFDITNGSATINYIINYAPNIIIHCAAYTAVDRAEDEKDLCYSINVEGTRYIVEAANRLNSKMVYISTDYVFSGEGHLPYNVEDETAPVNYYGMSKWLGEEEVRNNLANHFIIRISWVFGRNGNNFVKTMLKLAETKNEISVVSDQIGSPTYTYDVAQLIYKMIQTDDYGTYHATNEGVCSWYEFALEIFRLTGKVITVNPILSYDYPTKAARPLNSKLDKEKLSQNGISRLPNWQNALERYLGQ